MPIEISKAANISPGTGVPTAEELAAINKFTRRELTTEEVYTFSVVLCDNEIDRDNEQFTPDALRKLAELFVGTTGIYNHNWNAHEQVMRIFEANAEGVDGEQNSVGEPYVALRAKAYLLRSAENKRLIDAIDAGIRKEVSVSCSIGNVACSICGKAPWTDGGCLHRRGREYDGKLCYRILSEPTDAYEFSFVAVPAQPAAGITKAKTKPGEPGENMEQEGIMDEKALREQYPDLIAGIEKAAADAAEKAAGETAVREERARLEGIQKLAAGVDPEMVKEAMFGATACDKAAFAVRVLEAEQEARGKALKDLDKGLADSGAGDVGGAPNGGATPPAETPKKSFAEQAAEDIAALKELNGGAN